MRLVTLVDNCHGWVVEHSVYNDAGTLVARARLHQHRLDPNSGVVLPHGVDLDWPETKMALTLHLGEIEVNPTVLTAQTFSLPVIPNCPRMDLGTGPDTQPVRYTDDAQQTVP